MANLKFVPDLFISSQELNRYTQFLDTNGFRELLLQNSLNFGIVNNSLAGQFDNFRVQSGTNVGTIKINNGIAIDSNGELITYVATDNIALTNDSQWYWVTIAYQTDKREANLCSVDVAGNLSQPNGGLLSVLRGLPNNPVSISFPDAVLNTQQYEVVEVLSDIHALLAGSFQAETNLRVAILGAFSPDAVPPNTSQYPYQYDSCSLNLVLEVTLDTPPALTTGLQFTIARVQRSGSTIVIQDKRNSLYQAKADFALSTIASATNPLIGVEQATYDNKLSPKNRSLVRVAWGMRSTNWTIDATTNKVTILGGNGGKYKTTANFANGDFDGWRCYTKSGKYSIIRQSSIATLQINLILDHLDPDDYTDTTQELRIVPNVEAIQVIANVPGGQSALTQEEFSFPINQGYATLPLTIYASGSCEYTLSYRYRAFSTYTIKTLIPDDTGVGFYIETDFDADGNLTGSTKQTYFGGLITLLENPASYNKTIVSFITGDAYGVDVIDLDNGSNVIDFLVGTRKQFVFLTTGLSSFILTIDQYINLKSAGLKPGNSFIIEFYGNFVPGAFDIIITQDYVNSGSPGTFLYTFTKVAADDYTYAKNNNLTIRCLWTGTNWEISRSVSLESDGTTIATNSLGQIKVNTQAWNNLTLTSGWSGVVGNLPQYRLNALGRIEFRGVVVSSGGVSSGNFANGVPPPIDSAAGVVTINQTVYNITDQSLLNVTIFSTGAVTIPGYAPSKSYDLTQISYAVS